MHGPFSLMTFCGLAMVVLKILKVHIFSEGQKIMRNLHHRFVLCSARKSSQGVHFRWLLRIRWSGLLEFSQNIWTLHITVIHQPKVNWGRGSKLPILGRHSLWTAPYSKICTFWWACINGLWSFQQKVRALCNVAVADFAIFFTT